VPDRSANLPCVRGAAALEAGLVGRHDHRGAGRLRRTRRAWPLQAGVGLRVVEDVGHLQREGIPVAKSTVERLMRRHGWQGVRRQKSVRTTIADPTAVRPPDLVNRQFAVPAPNRLLVGTSPTSSWSPGCSFMPRWSSTPTRGRSWVGKPRRLSRPGSWSPRFARPQRSGHVRVIRSMVPSTTRDGSR
jgi:transposase InsO family protein